MMNCTMHHSYFKMGKQLYLLITDILITEITEIALLIFIKKPSFLFYICVLPKMMIDLLIMNNVDSYSLDV